MRLREHNESRILDEVSCARVVLDKLEAVAQARCTYVALVHVHAARDLADHIEKLLRKPVRVFELVSFKASRDINSARRQLNVWIARLLASLGC